MTTARLRDAVLRCLAEGEHELTALAEIEAATSARLLAQDRGFAALDMRELVHGLPHASFINAAFAYARPGTLNRFNDERRGAWYAALATATCLAEVTFHMTNFLRDAGDYRATVQYAEMFASLAGAYVDLRGRSHPALDPDPTAGYPAGNRLAETVRAVGHNGIIYPSVRDPGGTCIVALWPHAVQSVAQGEVIEVVWSGAAEPTVRSLPRSRT